MSAQRMPRLTAIRMRSNRVTRWRTALSAERSPEEMLRGDSVRKLPLRGLRGRKTRVQAVAERHQFIHFGDDAALFGKRRNCYYEHIGFISI